MDKKKGIVIGVILIAIIVIIIAIVIGKNNNKRNEEEINQMRQNTMGFLQNAYSVTENDITSNVETNRNEAEKAETISKEKQTGTAGSNISYADNDEQKQIDVRAAVGQYLKKTYGDDLAEYTITSVKLYNAEEINSNPMLKDKNLSDYEVPFMVTYNLKSAEGVEIMKFAVGNGEIEGDWINGKTAFGIVKVNGTDDYEMESWGTSF